MSASGKIMIIDDSEMVLLRVKARLAREGYEVLTVSNPASAARHLQQCDLVLLDFHMPGITGGEVLASLRKAGKSAGALPLFFLYTSDKTVSRTHRDLGFDGALINKGDDESLVQQLAAALRFAKLRRMTK
jgi:two-component system, OmpR family, response regulator